MPHISKPALHGLAKSTARPCSNLNHRYTMWEFYSGCIYPVDQIWTSEYLAKGPPATPLCYALLLFAYWLPSQQFLLSLTVSLYIFSLCVHLCVYLKGLRLSEMLELVLMCQEPFPIARENMQTRMSSTIALHRPTKLLDFLSVCRQWGHHLMSDSCSNSRMILAPGCLCCASQPHTYNFYIPYAHYKHTASWFHFKVQ